MQPAACACLPTQDALGLTTLASALTDQKDVGETAILVLMCLALFWVVKLQRQRMAQATQRRTGQERPQTEESEHEGDELAESAESEGQEDVRR
ncbi:hypothetical protein DUNSADRAFT_7608 [Dunaliella salina]|uniref:Uncharacterized protein n=1 Tax=Dunaliella salina TaxID=3046 RepID=A0ABQ7GL60_DUNSA|nr:hypothetical protein DUNSADRAFT_7608 [Dunaliella salina]|eukprot:KAF5835283.1 hypothetical protein DUNSADRAFT_7608 [Dunaliella salina]